jgi:hypothetical protein
VIDVLASAPQYADHAVAVFGALPEAERGAVVAPGFLGDRLSAYEVRSLSHSGGDNPVLVASYGDLGRALASGRTRIALMEHGAGQSYGGRHSSSMHGSYAGGRNRDAASLFLHPGEHPAERDRNAYPDARVEVVGSPILDTLPKREGAKGRVVAVSFHFNSPIAPEARNALPWIWPGVLSLTDRFEVLGHAHPRTFEKYRRSYEKHGIEPVREFTDVCRRADVYVCDNSSTLFAFAATGRPVVVVNPPWYDRRVNHGLRFWEAADVGVECNDPAELEAAVDEALKDKPAQKKRRERALDIVYAYRDGAAKRAADVLLEWAS